MKRRCPWCGEILKESRGMFTGRSSITNCKKCGKDSMPYERKTFYGSVLIEILLYIIFSYYLDRNYYFGITLFIATVIQVYYFIRVPFARIKNYEYVKWGNDQEQQFCDADIEWYIKMIKVFSYWNNQIMQIAFVKDENTVYTEKLNVRIIKKKSLYRINKINSIKINDFLNRYKNEMQRSNPVEFYIYDDNFKVIGKGKIIKNNG